MTATGNKKPRRGKRPGMVLPDGRDAAAMLTPGEWAQVEWRANVKRPPRIVWQEPPDVDVVYDAANPATWRAAVLQVYPMTRFSDGTLGRWLRQEWPDVDYPERDPGTGTLF